MNQTHKETIIQNFNLNESVAFQTVHSQFKPKTQNSRRKFTASLINSQPNCFKFLDE